MSEKSKTDYIKLYQELHQKETDYGTSGSNYYNEVCLVIDYLKPKTVLDFGCGKAVLIGQLEKKYPDIKFYGYDPAIPERSKLPLNKADLVINTDVLEHIPESQLPSVIQEISKISDKVFFGVHHALAYTLLPNGENAHCTVRPIFWYYHLFEKYFPCMTVLEGRESYLNTFLTFPVKPDFIKRYEDSIKKSKNDMKQYEDSIKACEDKIRKSEDKIKKCEETVTQLLALRSSARKRKKLSLKNKFYYKIWKHLDKKLRKKGLI